MMKINLRITIFVVSIILISTILWKMLPHNHGNRGCVDGVRWECQNLLQLVPEDGKNRAIELIKQLEYLKCTG